MSLEALYTYCLLNRTLTQLDLFIPCSLVPDKFACEVERGLLNASVLCSKEYFELPWPRVRLPLEPEIAKKTSIMLTVRLSPAHSADEQDWSYHTVPKASALNSSARVEQEIPKLGKLVQGSVTRITEKEVILEDGRTQQFDYLVLSTGSKWASALWGPTVTTLADRRAEHLVSTQP